MRYSSHHALVGNDSQREIVNRDAVVLATHDLRSHVARSAAGLLGVVWIPNAGYPEISHAQVSLIVEDQVLRLDVPVEDALAVDVLKSHHYASNEELCLLLAEAPVPRDVVSEIAPRQQVHHQIQVLSVLERELHIHYVAATPGKNCEIFTRFLAARGLSAH